MKNLLSFLLLFVTIPQLMAGVDYALVVKERDGKFYNHPEAKGYDFRACMEDFDLLHGERTAMTPLSVRTYVWLRRLMESHTFW